jgi:hypothetical protein
MLSVEDEWLIITRDRAPSHDGGSIWFMLVIGSGLCETGWGNWGKVENTGWEG